MIPDRIGLKAYLEASAGAMELRHEARHLFEQARALDRRARELLDEATAIHRRAWQEAGLPQSGPDADARPVDHRTPEERDEASRRIARQMLRPARPARRKAEAS